MWFQQFNRYKTFTVLIIVIIDNECETISNVNFNEQIRDYSVLDDNVNLTNVKTLQKEDIEQGRYASFAPLQTTVQFKEVADNVVSGSSHGRGLLHHDHGGYGPFAYEDPYYGQGYEYQHDSAHHDPQDYHHYDFHDDHHHGGHHVGGYGYHHKHYDHHALAAKTILWPIAGIALLGAAAALVSNPVLLQLGVLSGRKKRQIENLDIVQNSIKKWSPKPMKDENKLQNIPSFLVKRKFIQKDDKIVKPAEEIEGNLEPTEESMDNLEHKSRLRIISVLSRRHTDADEKRMIPIPLKFRKP